MMLSYREFYRRYHRVIRVKSKLRKHSKYSEITTMWYIPLLSPDDIGCLGGIRIPWYRDENYNHIAHRDPRRIHIRIGNAGDLESLSREQQRGLQKLTSSIRNYGLTRNINIVLAVDAKTGKSLVVDGVHRAMALFSIYSQNPSSCKKLFSGKYRVSLVIIQSDKIRKLFRCDFKRPGK